MKQLFCSVVALSIFVSAFATSPNTQRCFMKLVANDNAEAQVKLYENPDYSEAFDNGKDVTWNPNTAAGTVNIYAKASCGNLSMFVSNVMKNLPIAITTNAETSYKFVFTMITGTITMYDVVKDTIITLAENMEYPFTAVADTSITDRFIINPIIPEFEICHRYGKLQITGYEGEVIVRNAAGTAVITETVAAPYKEIDLDGQPNGQYTVELPAKSKTLTISVQNVKLMK